MVKEFQLPVNEGPFPTSPVIFRRFEQDESPIEVGSLERDAFSYLGDWYQVIGEDDYGIIYRIGIKERVVDSEGDLANLIIFFGNPISRKGLKIDDKVIETQYDMLRKVMEEAITIYSNQYSNLIGLMMPPTEDMLKELQ